jgi:hypothetical protein
MTQKTITLKFSIGTPSPAATKLLSCQTLMDGFRVFAWCFPV